MPRFDPHPERRPAVVTGASSGIGAAIAATLARAGHPVVLGARRVERCEATAAELRAEGAEAVAVALDLCDPQSIAAFCDQAEQLVGPVEVLVSNAGAVAPISVVGAQPDQFTRQLQVNLTGPQMLVHRLVPDMLERGRGDVVFVTSEVARAPRPHMAGYVAAKAGLEALAEAMWMELEGSGVRVGRVRPGPTASEQGTDWTLESIETVTSSWKHWGLLRHSGILRPGEVADAVLTMVGAPRGTNLALIEIQPEAPPPRRPEGTASTEAPTSTEASEPTRRSS